MANLDEGVLCMKLAKSGIMSHDAESDLYSKWEIHLTIAAYNVYVNRTITEFIMDPSLIEDGVIVSVHNPKMLPWLTAEECEKLRTRVIKILQLPPELPVWGPPPPRSQRKWTREEMIAILELPDEGLENGLELIRRKLIYKKFGI